MKLREIIDCEYDIDIKSLTISSKEKVTDGLYFCVNGTLDGHNFAKEAVLNGAVAIICERYVDGIDVPQVKVSDSRIAMTESASVFFGHPEKKLKMIGITGTNGKTTTSFIVASILEIWHKRAAVIGTNGIFFEGERWDSNLTTPDPIKLFEALNKLYLRGAEYVVMEVSAHAAALRKVENIEFEVAAFTNLTQDHLDFFSDLDSYFEAKRLFMRGRNKNIVINSDDKYGIKLLSEFPDAISYGCKNPSDVFGIDLEMSENGLKYILNIMDDIIGVRFALPGRFNMYNTMCAAAICHALGVPSDIISDGLKHVRKVDGRFEIINTTSCSVIIDFAHTDDGLTNVLSAIREFSRGKVITVFGCGGNRDRLKRRLMGEAAAKNSDYVIITSDNPRKENPMDIIREVEKGVGQHPHVLIEERREAIKYAIEYAGKGDIVLIAGKGAENYQEIGDKKIPYSDREYVMQLMTEEHI